MKPRPLFSLLTGVAVLGAVAAFNEMTPAAQASLLGSTGLILQTWLRSARNMITARESSTSPASPFAGSGKYAGEVASSTAATRAANAVADRPSGNPLRALPVKQLSSTRERPIFSPSRRPPPPTPTPVAAVAIQKPAPHPEPERPMVSLVGTVIGPGDRIAVFLDGSMNNVFRLRVGEDHQGWVLRLVNMRDVTMVRNGDQTVVFELPRPGDREATGQTTVLPVSGMIPISHQTSADEQPVRRRSNR